MSNLAPIISATEVDHWEAQVIERHPMKYREGPSKELDRPPHVRAASGLSAWHDGIAVIQDDANWLALIDRDGEVRAVPLPPSPHGDRVFSHKRGNRQDKYDLEACVTVRTGNRTELVGFASGSRPTRQSILRVRDSEDGELESEFVAAPAFYAMLRDTAEFSGAGLNIEGALALGPDRIRLFQRGNAKPKDGLEPVDATADLDWPALCRHLEDPDGTPPPPLENIRRYALGELDGARITFSDAELLDGGRVLFSASAERVGEGDDGEIVGSVLGMIEADGSARWTRLVDEKRAPFSDKIEGLTRLPDEPDRVHFVIDDDREDEPSAIFVARISRHFLDGDTT